MKNGTCNSIKLKSLLKGLNHVQCVGSKEVSITGMTADARVVAPGDLFFARKGGAHDGTAFIAQALASGAMAIVTPLYNPFIKKTQVICPHPETLQAHCASVFYRKPQKKLFLAAVTGTKGKTTTTYLLRHLFSCMGKPCGLMNTVEVITGGKRFPSLLTTHDVIMNYKILREMADHQCKAAVIEASSHGLAQGRVEGLTFDIALFTNLYPDHFDYHQTIENYAEAKRKLFENAKAGVYNGDSPWAQYMEKTGKGITFGIHFPAQIQAKGIEFQHGKTSFFIGAQSFTIPLLGKYNLYNVLGVIAAGVFLGETLANLARYFSAIPAIPGRLEPIENVFGLKVFVDYAHTKEALENVLQTLRSNGEKRIFVVFGCGGGRDPLRRFGMGSIAAALADFSIVTSDNAREEDPEEICAQIVSAFPDKQKVCVEIDRRTAIRKALGMAQAGDIVLIAGKGHEQTQVVKGKTIVFDDREVAREELQCL